MFLENFSARPWEAFQYGSGKFFSLFPGSFSTIKHVTGELFSTFLGNMPAFSQGTFQHVFEKLFSMLLESFSAYYQEIFKLFLRKVFSLSYRKISAYL